MGPGKGNTADGDHSRECWDGASSRAERPRGVCTREGSGAAPRPARSGVTDLAGSGPLNVLDRVPQHAAEACPSMYAYCTQALHLSEAEAYLRITTGRAA